MSEAKEGASPPRMRRRTSDTVTIACNLPTGFLMQLFDYEESVSILPNGREIKENVATLNAAAGQYLLNGSALDRAAVADAQLPDYRVIRGSQPGTGYALTSGIPRDFAEEWFRQNARSPLVKPPLGREPSIYMATSESRAADMAREDRDGRSGFEPLLQSKDPRVPTGRVISKYSASNDRITPEQAGIDEAEE